MPELAGTRTVLFLCTGNYYRSRFAEYYFRHHAAVRGLPWDAESRGLGLTPVNKGPLSNHTIEACRRLQISIEPLRDPLWVSPEDLQRAALAVAIKETEHRPMIQRDFPDWVDRVEYWGVHDVDFEPPETAIPRLRAKVDGLLERLASRHVEADSLR